MKKWYIYILAMSHLFADINVGAVQALIPFFVLHYGFDYKSAAGILFAVSAFSSIVQPIFGYLADKVTKSWLISLGITMSGISVAIAGFTSDYWTIFFFVSLMGVGNAIFHPEAARLVNLVSGKNKSFAMSIFSVGGTGGFFTGPLVAVAAVSWFGMKGTLIFGIMGVLMSAFLMAVVPKMKHDVAEEIKEKMVNKEMPVKVKNDWRAFGRLTGSILIRSIMQSTVTGFLPLYAIYVLGESTQTGSLLITVFAGAGMLTTWIGGLMADRIGNVRIVRFCMMLAIVCSFFVLQIKNVVYLFLLLLPLGFSISAPNAPLIVLGQKFLAKNVGFAAGVTMGIGFSIGGAVAPFLGYLGDTFGLTLVMQLLIVFSILGLCSTFLIPDDEKAVK